MIRIAKESDIESLLHIKSQLSIKSTHGENSRGGFLLGTDPETYRFYIKNAYCLVAESANKVVGFGIIVNDTLLRGSEIWSRRNMADWNIELDKYEDKNLGFFEQLAFLVGYRRLGISLSYNIVKWVFDSGCDTLFTTTVKEPVHNLAPLPFIKAAAGIKAGSILEEYPAVGQIKSDIYLINSDTFYTHTEKHPLYYFFRQNSISFG